MKWSKSPDELVQAFDHCLPIVPGVERKAMFGYPCAFLNGHLFCGLHQDSLIVRLPEGRREALVAGGASIFEPMPGRPMNEYVVAPADIVSDRGKLRALLEEALSHASSLAPKAKKERAAAKKATPGLKKAAPGVKKAGPAKKKAAPARKKAAPARKVAPARRAARKAAPKKKKAAHGRKAPAKK